MSICKSVIKILIIFIIAANLLLVRGRRSSKKVIFRQANLVARKRKTNLGNVIGQRKNIATKKLDQFRLFCCSREQIYLVENGLKAPSNGDFLVFGS
jgi:hypothetical protein